MAVRAICIISGDITGKIYFHQQTPDHPTTIEGYLLNVPRGEHGFHVHEFGDASNGCTSAGEHFNPFGHEHGAPDAIVKHVGDLGNIESKGYGALTTVNIVAKHITMHGQLSVLGRSLVVHANRDDLGLGDSMLSKITGNSGGRLGCGIIGVTTNSV
ncbi:Super oxide dismutase [Trabala vishnou gigantina nucleopolyhedrovirus]|uniref:Super oxide dismutase n=1 Tax=Trabala vishnou gigantina nucleopolyhedrovirus TaxID=2863583 RepID=UPI002481DD5A|nr:Super oxide dismutase [Trabala vishnou gigantina nucleopolyhedrovirus]QYC92749.1 Super oxide dismutase [Trabala vishnou gigantina nucleopolyhedrovirus]